MNQMKRKNHNIRKMEERDWGELADIYARGLDTGNASFEMRAPTWGAWDAEHLLHSRLVYAKGEQVAGFSALSPVSRRQVYQGVAEVSVYVDQDQKRQGIGFALLDELVSQSEENGIWTLQSGLFPENTASIVLHEKCGFRRVGMRERIAQRNGVWRDTLLMERRSSKFI